MKSPYGFGWSVRPERRSVSLTYEGRRTILKYSDSVAAAEVASLARDLLREGLSWQEMLAQLPPGEVGKMRPRLTAEDKASRAANADRRRQEMIAAAALREQLKADRAVVKAERKAAAKAKAEAERKEAELARSESRARQRAEAAEAAELARIERKLAREAERDQARVDREDQRDLSAWVRVRPSRKKTVRLLSSPKDPKPTSERSDKEPKPPRIRADKPIRAPHQPARRRAKTTRKNYCDDDIAAAIETFNSTPPELTFRRDDAWIKLCEVIYSLRASLAMAISGKSDRLTKAVRCLAKFSGGIEPIRSAARRAGITSLEDAFDLVDSVLLRAVTRYVPMYDEQGIRKSTIGFLTVSLAGNLRQDLLSEAGKCLLAESQFSRETETDLFGLFDVQHAHDLAALNSPIRIEISGRRVVATGPSETLGSKRKAILKAKSEQEAEDFAGRARLMLVRGCWADVERLASKRPGFIPPRSINDQFAQPRPKIRGSAKLNFNQQGPNSYFLEAKSASGRVSVGIADRKVATKLYELLREMSLMRAPWDDFVAIIEAHRVDKGVRTQAANRAADRAYQLVRKTLRESEKTGPFYRVTRRKRSVSITCGSDQREVAFKALKQAKSAENALRRARDQGFGFQAAIAALEAARAAQRHVAVISACGSAVTVYPSSNESDRTSVGVGSAANAKLQARRLRDLRDRGASYEALLAELEILREQRRLDPAAKETRLANLRKAKAAQAAAPPKIGLRKNGTGYKVEVFLGRVDGRKTFKAAMFRQDQAEALVLRLKELAQAGASRLQLADEISAAKKAAGRATAKLRAMVTSATLL